jgi:hypothetical protein
MTCAVQHCTGEAVGIWRWHGHEGFIRMPMCDEHRRHKAQSRAPGHFELFETAT